MLKVKKVLKKVIPKGLLAPLLPTYHLSRAVAANLKHQRPGKGMKVIAVTGTNGKTTTAHYIAAILEAAGHKVGLSTTATFKIGDKTWDNELNMTVTDPHELQELLKTMKAAKVDWVVLEVTSHALVQHRIWGVPIHTAVMTNLTQDHLDYHQTMDQYAAAKAKLFRLAKHNAVLNHDDEWYGYFAQVAPQHRFSYGVHQESDVRLLRASLRADGSKIKLHYGQDGVELTAELALLGKFNVYNALAAATTGLALSFNADTVRQGLEGLQSVPGRMENIEAGQNFTVLVDYAHTPDALRNLLETLKPLTRGRVIVVFGATGDRDKGKRPLMGSIAAKGAHVVVITDDDPYTENPKTIREEVLAGTRQANTLAEVIEISDRHDAIARAFQIAQAGDTVAICGLGHQHFRVVGEQKEPWDDREVARKLLAKRRTKKG